jgi:hypothetical protein
MPAKFASHQLVRASAQRAVDTTTGLNLECNLGPQNWLPLCFLAGRTTLFVTRWHAYI